MSGWGPGSEYAERNNPLLADNWPGGTPNPSMPGGMPEFRLGTWQSGPESLTWSVVAATLWRATWRSAILDLRPEFRPSADSSSSALRSVPVNRQPALGAGTFMRVLVFGTSANTEPAVLGGITLSMLELGTDQPPKPLENGLYDLFALSQMTTITESLQEGGSSQTLDGFTVRGACPLVFEPPASGMRFWQVYLQFDYDDGGLVDPNTYGWKVQGSAY